MPPMGITYGQEKEMTETTQDTIRQQECLRCGHSWWPRSTERPIICPNCKSPYWDRPRVVQLPQAEKEEK